MYSCLQALTVFLGTDGTVGNKFDLIHSYTENGSRERDLL